MNSNDISQLIERALAWLEEEYARYLQLKKSYNNLKDKVDSVAVQEFDSGKIRRIIRKIGKAEWRFDRYQKNLKPVMVV
ncbi:hypothetical protein HYT52_00130, partial [Candidatus Woesearchaeota archaeon]|nr:hypothetical protein [Candidatus Woesearchaeota archaeon]